MIANAVSKTCDTNGAASAAAPVPAGAASPPADTGAFDAMMVLQAQMGDASAEAAALPPLGAVAAPAAVTAGDTPTTNDPADGGVDGGTDDPLSFLNLMLPFGLMPAPVAAAAGGTAADTDEDAAPVCSAPLSAQRAALAAQLQADALAAAGDRGAGAAPGAALPLEVAGKAATGDAGAPDKFIAALSATPPAAATGAADELAGMGATAEMLAHGSRHQAIAHADQTTVNTPVRDPRWADELGMRLATMARTGESSASLQLSPPDLGPLEVNVTVRDSQATIHFGAAHAETRALLEASMPRLREMLASQGYQLLDSSVSQGFARQARQDAPATPRFEGGGDSPAEVVRSVHHITSLLDLYA